MKPTILIDKSIIGGAVVLPAAGAEIGTFEVEREYLPATVFQRGLAGSEEAVLQVLIAPEDDRNYLLVEDCEDAWNEISNANVTSTADAGDKKVGTASADLVVAVGALANELLAAEAINPSLDLRNYDQLRLWIKSSVVTTAGQLQILLDNTAQCASPVATLNVPALTAGAWTEVVLPYDRTLAGLEAIVSIGVKQVADLGAFTLNIDNVVAEQGWTDVTQGGTTLKLNTSNTALRLDQPGRYRVKCLAAAGPTRLGVY